MRLKVLLPHRVCLDTDKVSRAVIPTSAGSYGILPHRFDFAAMLVPGILVFDDAAGNERFVAMDRGIAIKAGTDLTISVRNAIESTDLGHLREAIQSSFHDLDQSEVASRTTGARLESTLLRRFKDLQDG